MKKKPKIRRRIEKKLVDVEEKRTEVPNPAWDAKLFKHLYREGREHEYDIEQYNVKVKETEIFEEKEILEYEIKCLYCGTKKWMLRRNAKYCSDSCRVMAYKDRKAAKKTKK